MEWSWYIAADFQLFLLVPWLVNSYIQNKGRGNNLITYMIAGSIFYRLLAMMSIEAELNLDGSMDVTYLKVIFRNPLARLGVYALGIKLGLTYKDHKDQGDSLYFKIVQYSRPVKNLAVVLGFILIILVVGIPAGLQGDGEWSSTFHVIYLALGPYLFVIGAALIVTSCMASPDIVYSRVLSTYFLRVSSRISYSAYLLYGMLILIHIMGQESGVPLSLEGTGVDALGNIVVILVAAGIFYLCLERPILNFEATFMPNITIDSEAIIAKLESAKVQEFDLSKLSSTTQDVGEM